MRFWQDEAVCIGRNTEFFFPNDKQLNKIRAAKAVCRDCPVRKECLQYAFENELDGIFGGTTFSERSMMLLLMPDLMDQLFSSDDHTDIQLEIYEVQIHTESYPSDTPKPEQFPFSFDPLSLDNQSQVEEQDSPAA